MDIKVTTENVVIDQESLNKGEYNIRECNFDLADEFKGLICKALFTIRKTNLTYQQDIVNSKCTIPYEATERKGIVEVGVIAYEVQDEELIKRYSPAPDVFFVIDGSYIEDIENQSTPTPSELEQLEQRVSAIEIDAEQVEINTEDIADIKEEQITQNADISNLQTNKADKSEIPDVSDFVTKDVNDLTYYTLTTQTGSQIELSLNSTNFKMTATLKDKNGNTVNTSNEIDLPLESVVVNASYDSSTKEIVLTLQNGNTVRVSIADLVSGLQTEITSTNKLNADLVDDSTSTNKFVTASEKTQITTNKNNITSLNTNKEDKSNKVTSLNSSSTNTQYPSAKVVYDNLITKADKSSLVTGTGENITLQNTAELEFIQPPLPRGNSEQVQYSGKNLLDRDVSLTGWQLTKENYQNGIKLTSTASSGVCYIKYTFPFEYTTAQNIYLNFIKSGTGFVNIYFYDENHTEVRSTSNKTEPFSLLNIPTTAKTVDLYFYGDTSAVGKVTIFDNVQLELGGSATSYEPYVGGTASPNPSYPQSISNVTGDVEVLVQNKNIWGNLSWLSGTYKYFKLPKENTDYFLKLTLKEGKTIPSGLFVGFTYSGANSDGGIKWIVANGNMSYPNGIRNYASASSKYYNYVSVYPTSYAETLTEYFDIQLEQGTTATTYTPHKEQTLPLTLGDIELCKIGNYQDYFYKENSKWYLYKIIGKTVIPSGVDIYSLNLTGYKLPKVSISKGVLGMIRNFSNDVCLSNIWNKTTFSNPSNFGITTAAGLNDLWFFIEGITSIEDAREYIEGSTFYSVQATPTITEITDTTLISQLDAISNAISYDEQTNISGSSDESNPLFEVQAVQYKEPDYWTIAYVNGQIGNAIGGAY